MLTLRESINIQAGPEQVWPILQDVENWPCWNPSVTSVQRLDSGDFQLGSRALIHQPKLRPAIWRVTELTAGKSFTWQSGVWGLTVLGEHVIERSSSGSIVMLTLRFSGFLAPFVVPFFRDLSQKYMSAEAAGLRDRIEREN